MSLLSFSNKIVIIGSTLKEHHDVFDTPFNSFENLEKNAIDFYASVRSLYVQDRQQKIINSKKIIDTQNDSDWEEIDTQ